MKYIYRMVTVLIIMMLGGCHMGNSPELTSCIQTCKEKSVICEKNCQNDCEQCSHCSTQNATHGFLRYKHQQCVKGSKIARDLQSYRDPLKCRKTTCNCLADLNVCIQSCRGVIHKRLQVPPTCC